ncbi:uncharacterized protein EV422DRAFT_540507 [Fimicolochytrium jonesii]|uniref:uncharacterized protein n=1 Tax=Fimicolochytrium jonesii TaxID=1396493 RepID=UPI0022FE3B96|nr:uncharacterized protein EV422DRAFT_540507 [Fimicolochytrium jonesii]KAI8817683.1 hypothetical protein EV422DRAFT_540507 [Fimicolochytrium jonesii]
MTNSLTSPLDIFRAHPDETRLDELGKRLLDSVPDRQPATLARAVQNIILHQQHIELCGAKAAFTEADTERDLSLRSAQRIIDHWVARNPRNSSSGSDTQTTPSLVVPREASARVVGTCREFALLFTSFLRESGVPARPRVGFADYFSGEGCDFFVDHWVTEFWHADAGRWVLADAELDDMVCKRNNILFDPLDVPRDRFLVGGDAWLAVEVEKRLQGDEFGMPWLKGVGMVAGAVERDLAALNGTSPLCWEAWPECLMLRVPIKGPVPDEVKEDYGVLAEASSKAGKKGDITEEIRMLEKAITHGAFAKCQPNQMIDLRQE